MSRPQSGRAGRNAARPGDDVVMHAQHAVTVSPWVGMARQDAREFFRDNPGATWTEFDAWVADVYEPSILTGYGWRAGQRLIPVLREALDAAHVGLTEAAVVEVRRRAGRDVPLGASDGPVERPAAPGAGVGVGPWRDSAHRGSGAA